jgi:hypothetical protein
MMPSAAHKNELNSTTNVPVKNSIEQSPLIRAILPLPSDSMVFIVYCPIDAFFPSENQLATSQACIPNLVSSCTQKSKIVNLELVQRERERSQIQHVASPLTSSISKFHRTTLFARASTSGGTVRPICFAAFKLMTNSNFVACCTGKSAGLAPFKILST